MPDSDWDDDIVPPKPEEARPRTPTNDSGRSTNGSGRFSSSGGSGQDRGRGAVQSYSGRGARRGNDRDQEVWGGGATGNAPYSPRGAYNDNGYGRGRGRDDGGYGGGGRGGGFGGRGGSFGGRDTYNGDFENGYSRGRGREDGGYGFGGRGGGFGGRDTYNRDSDNGYGRGRGREDGGYGGGGRDSHNRDSYNRDSDNGYGRGRGRDDGGYGGGRGSFGGRGGGGRSCFKCGEEGHFANDCFNSNGSSDRGRGGGRGRGGYGGSSGCFKCGEEGHFANECFNSSGASDGGRGGRGRGCFKCGEEGHFASECFNSSGASDGKHEAKPREDYRPSEEGQDELFEHGISSGINFSKYEHIQCRVTGDNAVHSIASFEESGLRQLLLENIKKSHYTTPTPVQKYSIPIVKEGRDLMACAQTGSGKTAAFLLPIIHNLLEGGVQSHQNKCPQEPEVIVMAPTRELAVQIKDEARKFAMGSGVNCCCVYGGVSSSYQMELMGRGVNILIATPGRLLDFVNRGQIRFGNLRFLVLDEADRMLDLGFMPAVQEMVRNPSMPDKERRQTLMFSATFPREIQEAACEFLNNYLFLTVGIVGGACADVVQSFFSVEPFQKRDKLIEILKDAPIKSREKTLIFVEKKKSADFLAAYLSQTEFPATSIHGDRLQREREEALRDFKSGNRPILVATAVAARGLDIRDVAHVVNYDMPKQIDEYVHRIGRTGRMGNTGRATSLYNEAEDGPIARDLVHVLKDAQQEVPAWLETQAARNVTSAGGFNARSSFGGRDIRQKSVYDRAASPNEKAFNPGPTAEDEMWD